MKKILSIFMLLVAFTTGAWAETRIVASWDFAARQTQVENKTVVSYSSTTVRIGTDCNLGTDFENGLAFQGSGSWFYYTSGGLYNGNGGGRVIGVLNLKSGDVVTVNANGGLPTSATNGTYDSEKSTGTQAIYTVTNDGNFGISITRYYTLTSLIVTREVEEGTCEDPTYSITGAYNNSRTFTLACETENSDIYYSTSELVSAEGGTLYEGAVQTEAATIWAYAKTSEATSNVISFSTGAGTKVVLNNPVISGLSLAENDAYYTPTYTFANGDNSSLIGSPSATLTATFNDVPLLGFTGTFTPTQDGTLVVTSSADGYASSQISVNCYVRYSQFWQSVDYSTLTEAEMTESYPTWTKSESGRWASWKDKGSNYTYYSVTDGEDGYAEFTFDTYFKIRRNVASLVEGFGIGRNVTGGETLTVNDATDDDIVALKIYNGYGNSAAAASNYTVYTLRNGANVTCSLSNGKLLMQGTIYRPVASVSGTLPSSGIGTLASAYPLDLSGVEAYVISEIDAEGRAICTQITEAAAGTGIIIVGNAGAKYNIPVVASAEAPASNLLVGAVTETGLTVGDAILQDGKFHAIKNASSLAAGKAYLPAQYVPVANGNDARSISLSFGEITGVSEVAAEAKAVADGKFIKNGQLVIEKNGKVFNANGAQVK